MTKSHKDDYFEAENPVHRLSYCAFLDVLGFSERIRTSYSDKGGNSLLQEFHKILSKRIVQLESDTDESLLYFKSFTDNIILAHPRFSDDMESEFAFILWSISEYQFEMALQGFFIRGGLSIGPLFVDNNSVYGQALIDAYHLESKVAINPIVTLSDDVMKLIDHHVGYYKGETAPQVRNVLVNADGRYFINYLSECIVDTDHDEAINFEALETHKNQIELALTKYAAQPAVFAKFGWLAAYHNHFCDSINSYPGYSEPLKVADSLSTVQFGKIAAK